MNDTSRQVAPGGPVPQHEAPTISRLGTLAELTLGVPFDAGTGLFEQFRES